MDYNAVLEIQKMDNHYPNSDLSYHYFKHREEIVSLTQTIEQIWLSKKIDSASFEKLFTGMKNTWVVVYYYVVGEQLNNMIGKIEGIESLLHMGITDKNWKTRFNTTVILKAIHQKEIKSKLHQIALNDKSKNVRQMAEDVLENYMN